MKLKLKNFKCFHEAIFEFDGQLIYINAPSGYGKSTILMAIQFALWGTPSDVITYGKKYCEVILEYKEYIFTRRKGPNYFMIQLKSTLEEVDFPVDFINIHFKQPVFNFMQLSSSKQYEILETIFDSQNNSHKILSDINRLISEGKVALDTMTSEIVYKKQTIENDKKFLIPDLNNKPTTVFAQHEIDKVFSEITNIGKQIDTLNLLSKYNQKSSTGYSVFELQTRISNYNKLHEKLNRLKTIDEPEDIKKCEEILIKEENKRIENGMLRKQITAIYNKLSVEAVYDSEVVRSMIESEKETVIEGKNLTCPQCFSSLILKDENLFIVKKNKVLEFTEILNLLDKIQPEVNVQHLKLIIKKFYILKELEGLNLDRDKILLEKELEFQEFNKIKKIPLISEDVSVLEEKISKLRQVHRDMETATEQLKIWDMNIKIKNRITELEKDVIVKEEKCKLYSCKLQQLQKLKEMVNESQKVSMKSLIDKINKELSALVDKFMTKDDFVARFSVEKEIKSSKIVKYDINIEIFRKGQKVTRPHYNLSSGEFARISLAVDLVLFKFFNTKAPIFLDEVTSNLDETLTTKIFSHVKSVFPDQDIYVIAHQIVNGFFDKVYDVEFIDSNSTKY
nr:MAG: ATPase [Diabrotica toursvirus 3a]